MPGMGDARAREANQNVNAQQELEPKTHHRNEGQDQKLPFG